MNVLNLKFSLSPVNFCTPLNLPTCMTCSKLHVILDPHLSSLLLAHQLAPPYKLPVVLFATHHLTSGIKFLTDFVSHVLICLFLIHLFSTIISPHECHRHSYHPSSIILLLQRQNFSFSQILPSIDICHLFGLISRTSGRTALRFFLRFSFFLASVRPIVV